MKNFKIDKNNIFDLIGVLVGAAAIIVGLVFIFGSGTEMGSSSNRSITFGADFYTEMYSVANGIYNREYFLIKAVEHLGRGMGFAFLFFGVIDILVFLKRLIGTGESSGDGAKTAASENMEILENAAAGADQQENRAAQEAAGAGQGSEAAEIPSDINIPEELKANKALLDSGVITEEEFEAIKKDLLERR